MALQYVDDEKGEAKGGKAGNTPDTTSADFDVINIDLNAVKECDFSKTSPQTKLT